jgi:molybdopterin-containing oxidoreductase family iron-sulfur binding subunit
MKKLSEIMDRRGFLISGAFVGTAAAVGVGAVVKDRLPSTSNDPTGESSIRKLNVLSSVKSGENEDDHVRMQRELVSAMAKPVENRHWIMAIDLRKCIGCYACTVGCVAENKLPPGVVYRPVIAQETGEYPNVNLKFLPRPCMQCDNPSCVPVCPVNATWKRPDGVVVVDYDKCIGCRYCLNACPYGARTSDFGRFYSSDAAQGAETNKDDRPVYGTVTPWQKETSNEYAKSWDRGKHGSPIGNARKCHFCLHRLEVGQLPMCVTTCIGRATYFGDSNDASSLIMEVVSRNNPQTLLPHLGNKPQCFYIF